MDMKDRTVYIRNLSPNVKEELIYELFLQAGPLESVKLIGDYGFVTFEHDCSVPYACSLLNDIMVCTSNLSVKPRAGSKYESSQIVDAIPNRASMMLAAQKNHIWQASSQFSESHNSAVYNQREPESYSDYSRNRNSQSQRHDYRPNNSSRERSPVRYSRNSFELRNPESTRRQSFAPNAVNNYHQQREERPPPSNPPNREWERHRNGNHTISMNESQYRHRDYSHNQVPRDLSGRYQPIDRSVSFSGGNYHDHRNNSQNQSINRSNSYHQRSYHQDNNYSRDNYYK